MKTSEIFIHQSIKQLGSTNQWIVTSRNNQTIIINTYSFEQFHPFRLIPEHHRRQCKEFELRQLYALPHTPKIILVKKNQKNGEQLLLLAQRGQFQFNRFVHHYQNDQKSQIQLTLKIIITVQMLQKKYGYFRLTQEMIKASRGPSLLIWISENQVNNQPQLPIGPFYQINLENKNSLTQNNKNPMEIMIRSIFEILIKAFSQNKILNEILSLSSESLTFESVKRRLNQNIKDQVTSNITITSENCEKNRRNTEQKRKKIPEFLLNRNNIKAKQIEINKTVQYSPNNNLINAVFAKQYIKNQQSRNILIKKIANTKVLQAKRAQNQEIILGNDSIKTKDTRQNQITSKDSIKYQQEVLKFRKPYLTTHEQTPIQMLNKQKPMVRQSGKSVSTSCAQYFSINSSGKKTILQNISTQEEMTFSLIKMKEKKQNTKLIRHSYKREESNHSSFYHQHIKPQVLVSKIIEQNNEDNQIQSQSQSQSTRSPRSPSILATLQNNNTIYEKNISSPGSEFFKDVDNLLHSGAISRQVQSEIDRSMQGELHRILFD